MERARLKVVVRGAIQGVGFRPFVYRLAQELHLDGWVINSNQGVFIEVEGGLSDVSNFEHLIRKEKPPRAVVQSCETWRLDPVGYVGFEIRHSEDSGERSVLIMPDIATCSDCLADLSDPSNRRYRYPFTNCTNCGPRYSIVRRLPYDRINTTMSAFTQCPQCQAEYDNPLDRRFHAQPNACPVCGPQVSLLDSTGSLLCEKEAALEQTVEVLRAGEVVAVKGIGGFHLMVDALNEKAVARLRERKRREYKPLAVMAPDLAWAMQIGSVGEPERLALTSPESPIVLLEKIPAGVASNVAPGNPYLGVMLPYSPLHWVLLKMLGHPVVATSGNLSDEPMCTQNEEALSRLNGIADKFLMHDRPIERHVDDSIVRIIDGREMVIRRARGYAPLPVQLPREMEPSLAVGAQLKNAVAFSVGKNAFVSQHIGDLESVEAYQAFQKVIQDVEGLYQIKPEHIACDAHPDYASTALAHRLSPKVLEVQHHFAHVLSCMADNELKPPCLGVAWDGVGLGSDGTMWGGEFLRVDEQGWQRVGHLAPLRLPGGDKAVREPWRLAVSVLYEALGAEKMGEIESLKRFDVGSVLSMLEKNLNSPLSSGAGRLFDAVSALCGICSETRFEGQAAMELEFACDPRVHLEPYNIQRVEDTLDWRPAILEIVDDLKNRVPHSTISGRFHAGLVQGIVAMVLHLNEKRVVLTGGCFQNRILLERTINALRDAGVTPYWHQRIPPNDGGICVGQLMALNRERTETV